LNIPPRTGLAGARPRGGHDHKGRILAGQSSIYRRPTARDPVLVSSKADKPL